MAHTHSVYDTDSHFSVDPITRQITNLSSKKGILIKGDHNSERFTFEIPRMIEGHDMSECNMVQVHYTNISGTDRTKFSADVYEPDDLQISPDGDDVVICSWLISGTATEYVGSLNFCLRLACATGSEMDYVWVSAVHSGITVAESIDASGLIVEQYPDVLEKWYLELFNTGNMGVNAILAAQEQALVAIEEKTDDILGDVDQALDSILAIQAKLMGLYVIRFAEDLGEENIVFTAVLDGDKTLSRGECVGGVYCAKTVKITAPGNCFFYGTTESGDEVEYMVLLSNGLTAENTFDLTENVKITRVTGEADVPAGQHTITFPQQLSYTDFSVAFDNDVDNPDFAGMMAETLSGRTISATKIRFRSQGDEEFDIYGATESG